MSEQTVLEEAGAIVTGARQGTYGHPAASFTRIAAVWSAVLGVTLTAEQVVLCMVGLKLCREAHKPARDNLVDIAGYAAVLEMVAESASCPCGDTGRSNHNHGPTLFPVPDIVDGDGDTWEFHHSYRGVPQYVMRQGDGVPRTAGEIHDRYPPREIVDGEGDTWVYADDGRYTLRRPSGGLAQRTVDLVAQTPESIYERFGRPAA